MEDKAAQTHNADELDTPAAVGTLPSITISSPTNLSIESPLTPALYPARKYLA